MEADAEEFSFSLEEINKTFGDLAKREDEYYYDLIARLSLQQHPTHRRQINQWLDNMERIRNSPYNGYIDDYILVARHEHKFTSKCGICAQHIMNFEFLRHLEECAKSKNANEAQISLARYEFLSNEYCIRKEFFKIRARLELSHMRVYLDREKVADMECVLCETLQDHLEESCMRDMQQATFAHFATLEVDKMMALFEHYCELKRDDEIRKLFSRQRARRARADALNGTPQELGELLFTFLYFDDVRDERELKELNNLLQSYMEEFGIAFANRYAKIQHMINQFQNKMVRYITATRSKGAERLEQAIVERENIKLHKCIPSFQPSLIQHLCNEHVPDFIANLISDNSLVIIIVFMIGLGMSLTLQMFSVARAYFLT